MTTNAVHWLDNRSHQKILDKIFVKLKQFHQTFIDKTGEVPFNYSERSLVGHMAIAAHDCGCYTLQDYDVSVSEKVKKGKQKRYRPDLWLEATGFTGHDYVFEVKADYMSIGTTAGKLGSKIDRILGRAEEQLSRQALFEGKYRCALVAARLYCSASKWQDYGDNAQSYNNTLKKLRDTVASIAWNTYKTKPNFHCDYFIPFDVVKRLCGKDTAGREVPPFLGIVYFGSLKRYRE